jgi:hypothetical protein
MTLWKNAVNGYKISRLEMKDITNDNVVNINENGFSTTDDFDVSIFFLYCQRCGVRLYLGVEFHELTLFLVIVDGLNDCDDGYSD